MATDSRGTTILVGDKVARATVRGRRAIMEFRMVTKVDGEVVYLDDNYVPIRRTDALLVVSRGIKL